MWGVCKRWHSQPRRHYGTTSFSVPAPGKEATITSVLYRPKRVPEPERKALQNRENTFSEVPANYKDLPFPALMGLLTSLYHGLPQPTTEDGEPVPRTPQQLTTENYVMSIISKSLERSIRLGTAKETKLILDLLGGATRLQESAHKRDRVIFSSLISAYAAMGKLSEAQSWFEAYEVYKQSGWQPPARIAYHNLMQAHLNARDFSAVISLMEDLTLQQSSLPNAYTFHLVISAILQNPKLSESAKKKNLKSTVESMASLGVSLRSETVSMILTHYSAESLQSLAEYFDVHEWEGGLWSVQSSTGQQKKQEQFAFKMTEPVLDSLIDIYATTYNRMDLALELLRKSQVSHKGNYFRVLGLLKKADDGAAFFGLWNEMLKHWIQPSQRTIRHKIQLIGHAPNPAIVLQSLVKFYFAETETKLPMPTLWTLLKAGREYSDWPTLFALLGRVKNFNTNTSKKFLEELIEASLETNRNEHALTVLEVLQTYWPEEAKKIKEQHPELKKDGVYNKNK